VLTLLAELEALAIAILLAVRVDFDGIITDLNSADCTLYSTSNSTIVTRDTAPRLVFCFAATPRAKAPIEAFVIVIISTMIPN
jgi:hypothetical protein